MMLIFAMLWTMQRRMGYWGILFQKGYYHYR